MCGQAGERLFNGDDDRIRRGGAGRDANDVLRPEPRFVEIGCGLDVMHARAMPAAGFDQFARVVAVRTADNHDYVALLRQFDGCVLALLGRLADGVHEAHFGLRETLSQFVNEMADAFDRLRGLSHDAESRS